MTTQPMLITEAIPSAFTQRLLAMAWTRLGDPAQAAVLLGHGRSATSVLSAPKRLRGPLGHCFSNAARGSLKESNWRYCEGYVYNVKHDVLFEHAWLLDADGEFRETTWTDTTDMVYLGVPFGASEAAGLRRESDQPLLFGDWDRGFRLLRSHRSCCGPHMARRPGFRLLTARTTDEPADPRRSGVPRRTGG
jgi:hypothetical protein